MIRIVLLFVVLSLCGCGLTPGMQVDTSHMSITHNWRTSAKPVSSLLIPIDAKLITEQKKRDRMRSHYRVQPADVLAIQVWNHPEFNLSPMSPIENQQNLGTQSSMTAGPNGYLVNAYGTIFYPLLGQILVAGNTIDQIRNRLTHRLLKYIKDPQVYVRVAGFRSQKIYVMGEVLKPGMQPITDIPLSITDAIALAGGVDPQAADASHIYVIRGSPLKPSVYWLNAKSPDALILAGNFALKSHDVVYISTAGITRFNRVISQILPTVQTLWYTGALVNSNF